MRKESDGTICLLGRGGGGSSFRGGGGELF